MGIATAILGLALLSGETESFPAIRGEEFRAWFDAASRGRLTIRENVLARARGFRYVFIGGLHTGPGPMAGYFTQNIRELKSLGVPKRSIHLVHPSSRRTVEENRDDLRKELLQLAAEGPERLVVVAHSRGACDALTFALKDPEFVRNHIAALFLIQGPFGGTGLADFVLGEGEPLDKQLPPGHRFLARLLGNVERRLYERGRLGGLAGLTLEASRAYWKQLLREHEAAIPLIGPRTYFVESQARPEQLPLFQKTAARYLATYYGPSDGVVLVGHQSLPGLGTRLGPLDVGHTDLTRRFPASRAGKKTRHALIHAIVMAVGRVETAVADVR